MGRLVPATTRASGESPLAVATALVGRLLAIAMPQSVSPGATVWTAAADVAGRRAQAAAAATRDRASMRPAYHRHPSEHAGRAMFREPASHGSPAILTPDDRRA